jgi:hypothetical protein
MTARGERIGGEPMSAMIPSERPAHPEARTPVAGVEPYCGVGTRSTCGEVADTISVEEVWENYESPTKNHPTDRQAFAVAKQRDRTLG